MLAYIVAILFAMIWEIIFIGRGSIEFLDVFIHAPALLYPILIALSGVLFYGVYRRTWIVVIYAVLILGFIPIQDIANAPHSESSDSSITLTSWNIDGWKNDDQFLETLQEIDSNIVILQEVWLDTLSHQAFEVFERSSPEKYMDRVGEYIIISDFPLSNIDYDPDHRGFAAYSIETPSESIRLLNTHLSAPYLVSDSVEVRSKQFASLQAEIAKSENMILVGDFNTQKSHDFIRKLNKDFLINSWGYPTIMATWPSDIPLMRIDFGMFRNERFIVQGYDQECLPELSDHCKVTHTFAIN